MNDSEGAGRPRAVLWTRDYVLAIAVNLGIAVVFYLFTTAMALYAIEQFQVSETGGGLAAGAFVLGAVLARLFGGKYLDLMGRKRVLVVTLAACVLISAAHLLVIDYWLLILLRLVHGIVFGASSNAITTGAFAIIPGSRRGEGTGYYGMSTTLGSAIGPMLALFAGREFGSGSLFWLGSLIPVTGLIISIWLRIPERVVGAEERAEARRLTFSSLVERDSLPVSSIMLIAGLAFSSVLAFADGYGVSAGIEGVGGRFFAIYAVTVLISRLFVGRIQDTLGDNAVVFPLIVAFSLGLGVLAIAPSGIPLFLSAVLIGFGFGALMPVIQTIAVRVARPEKVALVTSTFYLTSDIGLGLGPIVSGLLIQLGGFHMLFLCFAVVVLLSLLMYWRNHGRRVSRRSLRHA